MSTKLKVLKSKASALESLVNDYLAHQRGRGLSPRTAALTANILERTFLPWCNKEGISAPDQLAQRMLDRFSANLLDRKLARESVRTYTRTVGTFIRWAQADDAIAAKVKLHQPEAEHKLVETLTREEIQKLEHAAKTERDKLIIRLLADTGIRLGELLGLRVGDLVEQGRERYIKVRGKGARERLVPLAPALFVRLRRYAGRDNERIFVTNRRSPKTHDFEPLAPRSVQNMIRFTADAAKLKRNIHPHLFRHSYATWALRKGMNPLQLQRILGHADLTMISTVYSHLTPSDSYTAMLELLKAND
jgi:integrase/recombinase XerD